MPAKELMGGVGLLWDITRSGSPPWTVNDAIQTNGQLNGLIEKAPDIHALRFYPNRISNLGVAGSVPAGPIEPSLESFAYIEAILPAKIEKKWGNV